MWYPRRKKKRKKKEESARRRTRAIAKGKALLEVSHPAVAGSGRVTSKFFGTDSESETETEEDRRKEFLKDKKVEKTASVKKRRLLREPTIAERMHSVQKHLEVIKSSSVPHLTATAKDWLKDIELIRAKTAPTMQGVLSGKIRERVVALHRVLDTLTVRLEEKGDLIYQKRRNNELQAELLASQRETNKLNRRVDELQKTVDELRRHFITDGKIPQAS